MIFQFVILIVILLSNLYNHTVTAVTETDTHVHVNGSLLFIHSVTANVNFTKTKLINNNNGDDLDIFLYKQNNKQLVARVNVVKDVKGLNKSYKLSNLQSNEIYDGLVNKLLTRPRPIPPAILNQHNKTNNNKLKWQSVRVRWARWARWARWPWPLQQIYHSFQLYTPFVVPDEQVNSTLRTGQLLDDELEKEMKSLLRINSWEITIYFDFGAIKLMNSDSFNWQDNQYALKILKYERLNTNTNTNTNNNNNNKIIIQLLSKNELLKGITLSNLSSHQLVELSLCKLSSWRSWDSRITTNLDLNSNYEYDNDIMNNNVSCDVLMDSINVFTGGIYKKGALTHSHSVNEKSADTDNINININITTSTAALLSDYYKPYEERIREFTTVSCYDYDYDYDDNDDEEYTGYPCDHSDVCIPLHWLCDGQSDCKEGDDEDYYQCNNNYNYNYYKPSYASTSTTCGKFEFRCKSRGKFICLPNSWLCDGHTDCYDAWDEQDENCYLWYNKVRPGYKVKPNYSYKGHCNRNEFRCWRGEDCIALKYVCDGTSDCLDASDELICDDWSRQCDLNTQFTCYNTKKETHQHHGTIRVSTSRRRCIPNSWLCDNEQDCANGEDETSTNCPNRNTLFSISTILRPFGINYLGI